MCEVTPRAACKSTKGNLANRDTDETCYGMPNHGEHPAHLTVAALVNGQFHLGEFGFRT